MRGFSLPCCRTLKRGRSERRRRRSQPLRSSLESSGRWSMTAGPGGRALAPTLQVTEVADTKHCETLNCRLQLVEKHSPLRNCNPPLFHSEMALLGLSTAPCTRLYARAPDLHQATSFAAVCIIVSENQPYEFGVLRLWALLGDSVRILVGGRHGEIVVTQRVQKRAADIVGMRIRFLKSLARTPLGPL